MPDPTDWLDTYGDRLFAYALSRVRDRHLAEDLVQEALLHALRGHDAFEGRSSLGTWLTGILRHRILDHERRAARRGTPQPVEHADGFAAGFFTPRGKWKLAPARWGREPDAEPERDELHRALERCLGNLPARAADALVLQGQVRGHDEIAALLDVTPNHLGVILHRARLALRACIETGWPPARATRPARKGRC